MYSIFSSWKSVRGFVVAHTPHLSTINESQLKWRERKRMSAWMQFVECLRPVYCCSQFTKRFGSVCGYFSFHCIHTNGTHGSAFSIRHTYNNNRLKFLIVFYSCIPTWCWQSNKANRSMHWNRLGLLPFAFSTTFLFRFFFCFTNRKLDSRQFFFAFKLNQNSVAVICRHLSLLLPFAFPFAMSFIFQMLIFSRFRYCCDRLRATQSFGLLSFSSLSISRISSI